MTVKNQMPRPVKFVSHPTDIAWEFVGTLMFVGGALVCGLIIALGIWAVWGGTF